MFQNIGTVEILIIAAILMVLFGAKKLPEFARGLGKSAVEFKTALKDDEGEEKSES
jgi:sec-independent protein translocase protein TatA